MIQLAPKKLPKLKRKGSEPSSPLNFQVLLLLVSGRVYSLGIFIMPIVILMLHHLPESLKSIW